MHRHHPSDVVIWIEGTPATSEECQVIHTAVVERGLTRFDAVAQAVAAELFARDGRRAGGDAAAMQRLRAWYDGAARRLLESQHGSSIRIVPAVPAPEATGDGAGEPSSSWRRPIGFYVALGGVLAAFQHVVQRHLFQGRSMDLASGLAVGAYLAAAIVGLVWWLDAPDTADPESRWEQC
jgi:hypothetical protein